MTDFVTDNTHQSTAAKGQTLVSFPGGTTSAPVATTSGATFTAGSAAANTIGTTLNVGGAVAKTYIATNTGASALTAGAVQMQGSNDGTNWVDTGSVLTITTLAAGATVTVTTDTQPWKYLRPRVSTTITTGGTATVVCSVAI